MNIKKEFLWYGIAVIGLIILVSLYVWNTGKYEASKVEVHKSFTQCLADNGAEFWGAFWCPHCAEQKRIFGSSAVKSLPYIECSEKDGRSVTQQCQDEYIRSYPTWRFENGMQCTGVLDIAVLSQMSGCAYPEYAEEEPPTPQEVYERIYLKRVEINLRQNLHTSELPSHEREAAVAEALNTFDEQNQMAFEEKFGYPLSGSTDIADVAELFIEQNCEVTEEVKALYREQEAQLQEAHLQDIQVQLDPEAEVQVTPETEVEVQVDPEIEG